MKLIPVIGYALALLLGCSVIQVRARYLESKSRSIDLKAWQTVELKTAIWAYILPLIGGGLSLYLLSTIPGSSGVNILISVVLALFVGLIGGVWLFLRFASARATIHEEKLIYTEGNDRDEIIASEVSTVSIYWFSFQVKLKSGRVILIPAKFRNSEILLAFLRRASARNVAGELDEL